MVTNIFKQFDKKILILLLGILITNISTFMLMPFLAIYMSTVLEYGAPSIGVALTVLVVSQKGFTFIGGLVSDRFGMKKIVLLGLIIRSIGFFIFTISNSYLIIIIASFFVGIGGSFFSPGLSAFIATISDSKRAQAFALRGTVINIASTVGPLLGAFLYQVSFFIIFCSAVIAHLIFAALVGLFIKEIPQKKNEDSVGKQFSNILSDQKLILFSLLISGFWFLQSQFSLTIPLYLEDHFGRGDLIGSLFATSGIIVILFQYKIINSMIHKFKKENILMIGIFLMACSFLILAALNHIFSLFIFIIPFTLGGILVAPLIEDIVSDLAPQGNVASYLGFVQLGWALGGMLGNILGGTIYQFYKNSHLYFANWLLFFGIGLVTVLFFTTLVNSTRKW
jgi:MFS family permease